MQWNNNQERIEDLAYMKYVKSQARKAVAVCRNYGSCNQRGAGCSACSDNSCNLRVVKED